MRFSRCWYKARWEKKIVAVKELHKSTRTCKDYFENEAKITLLFDHLNIVRAFGGCMGETPQLLLEFTQYGTLESLCDMIREPLSLNVFFTMLGDICLGMNYLTLFDIVHRDLNLGNFLLSCIPSSPDEYIIKVCDFGLGKDIDDPDGSHTAEVGALKYRAPEVYTSHYSTKCDVWSFGILSASLLVKNREEVLISDADVDASDFCQNDWDFLPRTRKELKKRRLSAFKIFKLYCRVLCETIKGCLEWNAEARPSFQKIVRFFSMVVGTAFTIDRHFPCLNEKK